MWTYVPDGYYILSINYYILLSIRWIYGFLNPTPRM